MQRLQAELELLGFDVRSRRGGRRDARAFVESARADAAVWLPRSSKAILLTRRDGSIERRAILARDGTDPSNALALRVAETLRGQLLLSAPKETPAQPAAQDTNAAPRSAETTNPPVVTSDRRALSVGGSLLSGMGSLAGPGLLLGLDAGYSLAEGLVLAGYLQAGLGRTPWNVDPPQFSASHLGAGGELRIRLLKDARFQGHLDVGLRLGVRSVSLRPETGAPDTRVSASTAALATGLLAEYSVPLLAWLRLGVICHAQVGFPVAWSAAPEAWTSRQRTTLLEQEASGSPDGTFFLGLRFAAAGRGFTRACAPNGVC